jgi:VWFA-related protein
MFRTLRLVAIAVVGVFFVGMHGESPSAAPTAPVASGQTPSLPSAPSEAASAITTIHARSNLVVIDVVVSDSKGNPVKGLTAADFTLTENNKPQTIKNFEEHTALPAVDALKIAALPKLPDGLFTNQAPVPANGPVNVLLLDYLNTPLASQPYARKQLTDYLNKAPAGTRIAIFALTTNLVMLQGFSSEPEVLKAALNSKDGVPQASVILTDPMNGGLQENKDLENLFSSDAQSAGQQLANIKRMEELTTADQQDLRANITLGAFDTLARYLVGIPGRKNVIWYSGAFPLSIEPTVEPAADLQDAFDSVVRNDEEVRKTDNMLTRAQIAMYPVDARGVFSDPANSVMNHLGKGPMQLIDETTAGTDATAKMDFLQQTAQEHETMQAMAEDTGGRAFIDTNDLSQAVSQAISNGSNYYTVTYTPSNAQWDGRFRAIKVKVSQPGVKLAYREGYFADDPNDRNRVVAGSTAIATSRPTAMTTAMMRGGPAPTEILFKARIRPSATSSEDEVMAGNQINPDPKVKVSGPYTRYGIDIVPDKSAISCPLSENGHRRCAVEVSTFVYDKDGTLLIATTARRAAVITASVYAKMQVSGMAFHQEISVPVKGNYYIRTGVHDLNTDKVGAVEVPVSVVAKLPPLKELASGKAPVDIPLGPAGAPAVIAPSTPAPVAAPK